MLLVIGTSLQDCEVNDTWHISDTQSIVLQSNLASCPTNLPLVGPHWVADEPVSNILMNMSNFLLNQTSWDSICGLLLNIFNTQHNFNIITAFKTPRENIISLMSWDSLTWPNLVLYKVDTHINWGSFFSSSEQESLIQSKWRHLWIISTIFPWGMMMVEYRWWTQSSTRWYFRCYTVHFNSPTSIFPDRPFTCTNLCFWCKIHCFSLILRICK